MHRALDTGSSPTCEASFVPEPTWNRAYSHARSRALALSLLALQIAGPANAEFQARTAIVLQPMFHPAPVEWALRDDGRVWFEAFRQQTGTNGLYLTGGPGGFVEIFDTGDAAPELPGLSLIGPLGEWVGRGDAYAFGAGLQGVGVDPGNDVALYLGTLTSGPQLVFREGDPVPDLPGSTYDFGPSNLRLARSAELLFEVPLQPSGKAMVLAGLSEVDVLFSTLAPGPAGDSLLGWDGQVMNDQGEIAFIGTRSDAVRTVYSGGPGAFQRRLSVGDIAPGVPGQTITALHSVSLSATNGLTIDCTVSSGASLVLTNVPGSPRALLQTFGVLYQPAVSAFGLVGARTGSGPTTEIWAETFDSLGDPERLAGSGDAHPDLEAGVVFGDLPDGPSVNLNGQSAFTAYVTGAGVAPANDFGLWHWDPTLGLELLAREGGQIRIAPADVRTISELFATLSGSQGASLQDGQNRSFNGFGEVLFKASFSDGQSALLAARSQRVLIFSSGFE